MRMSAEYDCAAGAASSAQADLTVAPVLETILTSRLFYSPDRVGREDSLAGRAGRGPAAGVGRQRPTWCSWPPAARAGTDALFSAERERLGWRPDLDRLLDAAGPGEPVRALIESPRDALRRRHARANTSNVEPAISREQSSIGSTSCWSPCRWRRSPRRSWSHGSMQGGVLAHEPCSNCSTCSVRCPNFSLPDGELPCTPLPAASFCRRHCSRRRCGPGLARAARAGFLLESAASGAEQRRATRSSSSSSSAAATTD